MAGSVVAGLIPSHFTVTQQLGGGEVFHTHTYTHASVVCNQAVIIWYRSKAGDDLHSGM